MRPASEQGTALIAISWVLLLLTVLVSGTLSVTTSELRIVDRMIERARLTAVADGALIQTLLELSLTEDVLRGGRRRYGLELGGADVEVSIQDEAGKVDVNHASEALLANVLESWSASPSQAEELAARIVDWRDEDSIRSPHGAEILDYRAAGARVGPRNGAITDLGELRQVLGMPVALLDCANAALTVYSGRSDVDASVIAAPLVGVLAGATPNRASVLAPPADGAIGRVLSLRAVATRGSGVLVRRAVVRLTGDPSRPVMVIAWSDTAEADCPETPRGLPARSSY